MGVLRLVHKSSRPSRGFASSVRVGHRDAKLAFCLNLHVLPRSSFSLGDVCLEGEVEGGEVGHSRLGCVVIDTTTQHKDSPARLQYFLLPSSFSLPFPLSLPWLHK
ncbi:hypothetical protein PMAYCL1PPCAC_18292 [Pristionchus mayeri]|uniref:Uncharacterized protein n=1 Tax=Pristionchus mayeri TaxID=1317129 RepID=A0AAN5CPJ1_9BILA|nr:hypothetical protein PMAYCL1PPCAC_18292 [Pristionchus mayeri]